MSLSTYIDMSEVKFQVELTPSQASTLSALLEVCSPALPERFRKEAEGIKSLLENSKIVGFKIKETKP